ncbi:MAG: DUF1643 domain-containing protein [Cyanobacteria bacterium J06635_15]
MVTSVPANRIGRRAVFDSTGQYRYALVRTWPTSAAIPPAALVFVMLNPSTADHRCDDPTIRRCMGFAQAWGYGQLEVVNLFALKTPHPRQLSQSSQPIGAENDRYLLTAVEQAERVVMAWGNWGHLQGRDRAIFNLLDPYLSKCHCFGWTKANQPRHPLYLKRTAALQPVLSSRPTAH